VKRTPSYAAQFAFNQMLRVEKLRVHSSVLPRVFARIADRIVKPIAKKLGTNHIVDATIYGHNMVMPAEHPLPVILATIPQFNRPLGLAVESIAATAVGDQELTVIDVGANIGETIAIIEQRIPGRCSYLCIEPEPEMSALCRLNHGNNSRVQVERAFIGENEGALVWLEDDGRANPSTKLVEGTNTEKQDSHGCLKRLDTVALPFAELHSRVSLIKVDTEGYDFSVLRSGSELLARYTPAIYLEWFPELLLGLNEQVWEGFDYLETLGYHHLVFFTNQGDFYCSTSSPNRMFFRGLASSTAGNKACPHFDVFLSASESVCNELIERSIAQNLKRVRSLTNHS
jgi:FkbM family methyltransferase